MSRFKQFICGLIGHKYKTYRRNKAIYVLCKRCLRLFRYWSEGRVFVEIHKSEFKGEIKHEPF
jgi:hypothetical protein